MPAQPEAYKTYKGKHFLSMSRIQPGMQVLLFNRIIDDYHTALASNF